MSGEKHIGLTDAQAEAVTTNVDPILLAEGLGLIQAEKTTSIGNALRNHWRAVLWSMLLSLALVMDGYDGAVSGAYFGLPAFINYFGKERNGKMVIDANWQTGMQNVGLPGSFIGLFICGWAQERYGSRKTYMGGMLLTICVVFLFVFAQNMGMLLAAQSVASCAWAIFNTLSAAYAVEICPIQLRGYAAGFISMCWGMGSFIASGVNRAALDVEGNWAWRMGYAIQWVWPVPLLVGAFFAPESPWWLVRHGKFDEAKAVLKRVARKGYWDSRNIDAYIAVIQHTDEIEQVEAKSGSFWELWKGTNLRRTEIVMGAFALVPVLSGTAMTAYTVQFLEGAGMTVSAAFNFNVIVNAMNLVGVLLEFVLISRFGRRPLMIGGLMILGSMLLLIGIFGSVHPTATTLRGIGACCAVINLVYHASVGPLTYTFAPEIPSSRLRVRTVAWGRAAYVICYNATSQLTPRMVSSTAWAWGAKAAYFWFGLNVAVTVWCFFRLPETKGLSYSDLNILFANKINARKFTKVVIHDEAAAGEGKILETEQSNKPEVEELERSAAVHSLI